MLPPFFKTARKLTNKIEAYFNYIEGEYRTETKSGKEEKKYSRDPEPATVAGLALYIGLTSLQELDDYEQNGEFGHIVSRGRLRVAAVYEKMLHNPSPSGALFALKNLCPNGRPGDRRANEDQVRYIKLMDAETGPAIAANEADVVT